MEFYILDPDKETGNELFIDAIHKFRYNVDDFSLDCSRNRGEFGKIARIIRNAIQEFDLESPGYI